MCYIVALSFISSHKAFDCGFVLLVKQTATLTLIGYYGDYYDCVKLTGATTALTMLLVSLFKFIT